MVRSTLDSPMILNLILGTAHTFVAWIFISFVFFMVTRESIYYINLRQAYLLSPLYAHRISSRTVLFASVPNDYASEAKMRQMFGSKLKNVWIATQTKELAEKVEERNKVAFKLEAAETKLIKLADAARRKSMKKGGHDVEAGVAQADISGESGSAAARWTKPKQRPTHKLKPLIGKKVDTINWCRSELQRMIPEVERDQELHRAGNARATNTAIVEFYDQTEAQAAYQMVAHHQPLHMSPRVIGLNPQEIVWSNTGITWRTRVIRNIACIAAVVVTIIFWYLIPFFSLALSRVIFDKQGDENLGPLAEGLLANLHWYRSIPVAVVGLISNINFLTEKLPFLSFINSIPEVILGVVTGLLPVILLAVLMALLPIWLRFLAKTAGLPTLSQIELRVQTSYFWFQVRIHCR
jgi:calcium permeable stress-gated cation channel